MKKPLFSILWLSLLLGTMTLPSHSQVVSNDNEDEVYKVDARMARMDYREGEVLVKFKANSNIHMKRQKSGKFQSSGVSSVDALFSQIGAEEVEELMPRTGAKMSARRVKSFTGTVVNDHNLGNLYRLKLNGEKQLSVQEAIEQLEASEDVEYAEPNYKVYIMTDDDYTLEPLFSQLWGIQAINLPSLWRAPKITQKRPVIAILDTGIDITHPDLADNIWTNTAEADGEEGYDNDNNGFVNDVHGWDFINQTGKIRDFNGHGTHCAGIAAAVGNNLIGVTGANPNALILPITVMQSDGTGDLATIIKGIDYAKANGADIISMSIGTYATSAAFKEALGKAYQSAILVAAAGNDGLCLNHAHPERGQLVPSPMFPAAYNFVLGVQASASSGNMAGFSNYDDDGAFFSAYGEDKLYNYELRAPGASILSTWINGNYRTLNGTSMACPLVAGALSRLIQCKEVDSKEELFGDLIHSNTPVGDLDIYKAYQMSDENRRPTLSFVTYEIDDNEGDGDGVPDAGETIAIYPTVRNSWGTANNIQLSIELGNMEDPEIVEFLDANVTLGSDLSSYAIGKASAPLRLKISENCVDGRHIKLKLKATCDNIIEQLQQDIILIAENGVELGGVIVEDMTLTADKNYIITNNLAVPSGVTLTIEPGTVLKFKDGTGLQCSGILNAIGEPGKMIEFTKAELGTGEITGFSPGSNTLKYISIHDLRGSSNLTFGGNSTIFENSICYNIIKTNGSFTSSSWNNSNITDLNCTYAFYGSYNKCNLCHDRDGGGFNYSNYHFNSNSVKNSNLYNNYFQNKLCLLTPYTTNIENITFDNPNYYGTGLISIAQTLVADINNLLGVYSGYAQLDLSNMLTQPNPEAHGIVWKVVVNGYDAQDEFEQLPPLGVGRHKFDVYFNRPMNKEVAPQISFGVRNPYTQHPVAEDGSWNEEGTIYTAYKTITGKTKSDGLNRIYVYGAEDDEFFEIPYENTRFNINIQAAGSMATGFMAEAGLGKVNLTWNNSENNFEDAMGFNVYRYTEETIDNPTRINEEIVDVETTEYTDYDVTPGTTYYYMYKVLSTDLQEYDMSNVVAATPQTGELGDANGSGGVDVADVMTTVNYAAGMEPKPFIFEAADVNTDQQIDILDVIGIIQMILNQEVGARLMNEGTAVYTIEDGTLYVESDVALAGVQVQLCLPQEHNGNITVDDELKGFEQAAAWLSDNDYLFLAFNLNGKTLAPGKHALLHIGNARINIIRLSDAIGHNVTAIGSEATAIDRMGCDVMNVKGTYDLQGRKLGNAPLKKGVYIINGQKVVK